VPRSHLGCPMTTAREQFKQAYRDARCNKASGPAFGRTHGAVSVLMDARTCCGTDTKSGCLKAAAGARHHALLQKRSPYPSSETRLWAMRWTFEAKGYLRRANNLQAPELP